MSTGRIAAIDVGTNTVLLLVAERRGEELVPLVERAEITRLGRGVDRSGRLDPAAIRDTVAVLSRYVAEARRLGADAIACVATSAARDAANSADFFASAREAAGIEPEVISGYRKTGTIGHSGALQTTSRLLQDLRGSDGTLYTKGTAIPVRADFTTLDNPFVWSARPIDRPQFRIRRALKGTRASSPGTLATRRKLAH